MSTDVRTEPTCPFFDNYAENKKKVATDLTLHRLRFSIHQKLLNVSQYLDRDPTWLLVSYISVTLGLGFDVVNVQRVPDDPSWAFKR
jgi:hypothetical protein